MIKLSLCVLVIVVVCHAVSEEEVFSKWVQFQKDFGKNYKSPVEASKRFNIFKARLGDIEQHNKLYKDGKVSYLRGLSTYSDLTAEEFNERFPKIIQEDSDGDSFIPYVSQNLNANLPAWIDWRMVPGVVSTPKQQGVCESCYTFSVTGALEGLARLRANKTLVLSEQALVDCSTIYGNMGCNQGYTSKTFDFVRTYGIPTEASYPYTGKDGKCQLYTPVFFIKGHYKVYGDENTLKEALYFNGPISITIHVTQTLQEYQGGVWDDPKCGNISNHAVLLVGYGTENGKDYWLIKNSWGPTWGPDGGFFKMVRGGNRCAIMSWPAYPYL